MPAFLEWVVLVEVRSKSRQRLHCCWTGVYLSMVPREASLMLRRTTITKQVLEELVARCILLHQRSRAAGRLPAMVVCRPKAAGLGTV